MTRSRTRAMLATALATAIVCTSSMPVTVTAIGTATTTATEQCAKYGLDAVRDLVRLVRDPADARRALVLSPDCAVQFATDVVTNGSVTELRIERQGIGEVVSYPAVQRLRLAGNAIGAFQFTAESAHLTELDLSRNLIRVADEMLDFSFPSSLEKINLSSSTITSLVGMQLPTSLRELDLRNCSLKRVNGFKLPRNLTALYLDGNEISYIEVRESDLKITAGLEKLVPALESECDTTNSNKTTISNSTICVLSDAIFETRYSFTQTVSAPVDSSQGTEFPSVTPDSAPMPVTAANDASNNQQVILIVVLVIGSMMLVVVLFIGYRVFRGNYDLKSSSGIGDGGPSSDNSAMDLKSARGQFVSCSSREHPLGLRSDFLDDPNLPFSDELMKLRIPKDRIEKKKVLARGGFGVVYLASYQGVSVAVKQIQREQLRTHTLQSFMREIHLCASLNHPRIVRFLGVSWSSLRDIAVVMELMPRGDLFSLLRQQRKSDKLKFSPTKRSKSDLEWFPDAAVSYSKSTIAMDVAEALIYLHSRDTPIIHRDLKSKNVLLADDYGAKLSDFGISRTQTVEETMTREVGTVAWIAPEVLKGARYSEKADIYSFGVLLTELDTCHPPYVLGFGPGSTKRTNTWIASMVSAGALQPTLLESCPMDVRELALKCMSFIPECRPSAVQIMSHLKLMVAHAYAHPS